MQPREAGGEGGTTAEEKAKLVLDDVLERLPAQFDMEEIRSRVDEVSPYVMVAIQVRTNREHFMLKSFKCVSCLHVDFGWSVTDLVPLDRLLPPTE